MVLLMPALEVRLQPVRGDSIFVEPVNQYFVVRKVLEQVHSEGEECFQGVLRVRNICSICNDYPSRSLYQRVQTRRLQPKLGRPAGWTFYVGAATA